MVHVVHALFFKRKTLWPYPENKYPNFGKIFSGSSRRSCFSKEQIGPFLVDHLDHARQAAPRLASGGPSSSVWSWTTWTGRPVRARPQYSAPVSTASISPTMALDAAIKLPEGAVAYRARTAGSGLDGVDGWIVVATERQERATPHVGRLCVVRIKGGPTVHGHSDGAYSVEQLWPETIISRTCGSNGHTLFCGCAPASQRTRGTGEKPGAVAVCSAFFIQSGDD